MPAASELGLGLPAAARMQALVQPRDFELTGRARWRHPSVRWWWGQRIRDGKNGAVCYVCDELIVTWYRARPITVAATGAILAHGTTHSAA